MFNPKLELEGIFKGQGYKKIQNEKKYLFWIRELTLKNHNLNH